MNENGFNLEDNDFGSLADIFPDIEPYLEDVTNSFETARNEIDKKKIEIHIDGSDSDSGISADNYANGIVKNLDSLLPGSIVPHEVLKTIKVTPAVASENNCISKSSKILIKRPISFISKIGTEIRQPIYNISSKIPDINYSRPKPIFLKSQPTCPKDSEMNKKQVSKITPIKLLKNNDGFPVIINEIDINKCDTYSFYEPANRQARKVDILNESSIKNEHEPCYNLLSLNSSQRPEKVFVKNELFNTINLPYDSNNIDDSCVADLETLIDEFKSEDCQSYFDIFSSDTNSKTKVLQTSSIYNNNNLINTNDNGMLDPHHYDRMVKKQERMIKNRQAASLSRQRKKEYVERLEHKLEQLKQENHYVQNQVTDMRERFCALEQENQLLKRDIQTWRERYYDLERQKIKQGIITTTFKLNDKNHELNGKVKALKATAASTTILGIFLILTFNFNSLNTNISSLYKSPTEKSFDDSIYQKDFQRVANGDGRGGDMIQNYFFAKKKLFGSSDVEGGGGSSVNHRLGRTLFSVSSNDDNTTTSSASSDNDEQINNNNHHICNNTTGGLNVTETIRLTRELNRWGSRFNAESVKVYDRLHNEKIKSQILSKEIQSNRNNKSKIRINGDVSMEMENDDEDGGKTGKSGRGDDNKKMRRRLESAQLEIYRKMKNSNDYGFFENFIDDIDRKPDTLYFVTFHSDNLIFPATNVMKNLSTPKITLVLPADINQKDKNYYKMMKIDCQVQNFTIVNLKKLKVP